MNMVYGGLFVLLHSSVGGLVLTGVRAILMCTLVYEWNDINYKFNLFSLLVVTT